jgi:hypothetical protein
MSVRLVGALLHRDMTDHSRPVAVIGDRPFSRRSQIADLVCLHETLRPRSNGEDDGVVRYTAGIRMPVFVAWRRIGVLSMVRIDSWR